MNKDLTPKMEMLELQQQFIEMQRDRDVAKAHLSAAKPQIASIQRQKAQAEEEFKRDRLKELADAETQATALDQELRKADERARLKRITTPVSACDPRRRSATGRRKPLSPACARRGSLRPSSLITP